MSSISNSAAQCSSYEYLVTSNRTIWATRLIFLLAGLAMAAWAPIVPIVQDKLKIDDFLLGLLLISLAIGSLTMMPVAAWLIDKLGCRKVILIGLVMILLAMPFFVIIPNFYAMLLVLLLFGAGLGLVDIAMNTQAVLLEKEANRPIMSGMHAFWSIGGVVGAGIVTALLSRGIPLGMIVIAVMGVILILFILNVKHLLPRHNTADNSSNEKTPFFVIPQGIVLVIGILCFILFCAEGAVLDWSAIYLNKNTGVSLEISGVGFFFFSVAMTLGRLTGDRVVAKLGRFNVLFYGSLLASIGYVLMVIMPYPVTAFLGFILIGVGASNAVPILFTAAGNQTLMPARLAIASVSMTGYGGMLLGPTMVGFVSKVFGLHISFLMIALLLLVVVACSRHVTQSTTE